MAAQDVVDWIAEIKLEDYLPVLTSHGLVTLADCCKLDGAMMDACGIEKIGHRRRLLRAVAVLNGEPSSELTNSRAGSARVPAVAPPRPALPPRATSVHSTQPSAVRPTPRPRPASVRRPGGQVLPVRSPSHPRPSGVPALVNEEADLPPALPPKRSGRRLSSQASTSSPPQTPTQPTPRPSSHASSSSTPPPTPTQPKPRLSADGGEASAVAPPRLPPKLAPAPASPTSWNPANAKAAAPSRLAEAMLQKKKGPPRPPMPIHRPQRNHDSKVFAGSKSIVAVEIEDDDDGADYVALPAPKRVSSLFSESGESIKKLETYKGQSTVVSQRTLTGFLSKKGGKTGTKGWDKRWFDLSDGELKYFKDKEKKANGVIPVSQMVDIRPTISGTLGGKHAHRFELDTPDRTYYFSADTVAEMTEWMMLIGALIQDKDKNKDKSEAVGGEMSDPDKAGWIQIRGNDLRQKWVRHYLAIKGDSMCFYGSYDEFAKEKASDRINFLFVNLKTPVAGSKKDRNNQFQILTNGPTFECRAESAGELKSIVGAIQAGIQYAYSQMKSDKTTDTEKIPNVKALEMMRENPNNIICADCGASKPDWASINLGVMFCLDCCGIHRGLGVHITKCRSAMMDEWSTSLISLLVGIGNRNSNDFWECALPDGVKPTLTATNEDRASYIRKKYVDREFATFRKDVSEYTIQTMKLNLKTDDLMLTLEHILAGIGPDHPGANAVLSEATKLGLDAHAELLRQNGFELTEDVPDEREREAFQLQDVDGSWKAVWIEYGGGMLSLLPAADALHPDESVPAGALKAVDDMGEHFELALATPVVVGSTRLALRPVNPESVQSWVIFLSSIVAELPSSSGMFDFASCSKVGMLTRIGGGGVPQKPRLFAVRDARLRYFTSQEDPQELGCIDCRSLRSIMPMVSPGCLGPDAVFESDGAFSLASEDALFVLDAGTSEEKLSWVCALRNTQVFGASIDSQTTTVPFVVDQCCTFLESQESAFDQLYAMPGDRERIDELKVAFNRDAEQCQLLAAGGYSANDVANLLQLYFMELPAPLLPSILLTDLAEVDDLDFDDLASLTLSPRIVDTAAQLPDSNRDTLDRMSQHVHHIAKLCPVYGAEGASTLDRLVCVFGPLLFGLDESNEANEAAVSLATCSVKLLWTHPALATHSTQ